MHQFKIFLEEDYIHKDSFDRAKNKELNLLFSPHSIAAIKIGKIKIKYIDTTLSTSYIMITLDVELFTEYEHLTHKICVSGLVPVFIRDLDKWEISYLVVKWK